MISYLVAKTCYGERNTCISLYWFKIACISSHKNCYSAFLFSCLELSISYDSCLSICSNIRYGIEGAFVASRLTLETFTIIAKDNIDLNAISTKVKKHFHGISITSMQFPSKEKQAVKQNVIHDLSLLDNSQKLSLPEDYEIISEPPYRKNTPLSLPVCTTNIEHLNYQDKLFKTIFDKKITWLKSFDSKNVLWSSYHSNNLTCNNSDCVLQINQCTPFRKKYRYVTHQNFDQKNTYAH